MALRGMKEKSNVTRVDRAGEKARDERKEIWNEKNGKKAKDGRNYRRKVYRGEGDGESAWERLTKQR